MSTYNGSCAICHRVLDWTHDHNGENGHWIHTYQDRVREDHEPVWEAESPTTEYRCDFCNVNEPTFLLPASDFSFFQGNVSVGEWLACGTCGELISNGHWPDLIERALTQSEAIKVGIMTGQLKRQEIRESLRGMYQMLRDHIIGPLEPWSP